MAYKALYYGYCKDLNGKTIKVWIWKNGYTGDTKDILFAEDPITITYERDDVLAPTFRSSASIKMLNKDLDKELYTGNPFDIRVGIQMPQSFWVGYASPNLYNSAYSKLYDEFEFEAIDLLSSMEYKEYKTVNQSNLFVEDTEDGFNEFSGYTTTDDTKITINDFYMNGNILHLKISYSGKTYGSATSLTGLKDNITYYMAYFASAFTMSCEAGLIQINGGDIEIDAPIQTQYNNPQLVTMAQALGACIKQVSDLQVDLHYINSLNDWDYELLNKWQVNENNFYDEEGKYLTCLDVVEQINKILGTTITPRYSTPKATAFKSHYLMCETAKIPLRKDNNCGGYTFRTTGISYMLCEQPLYDYTTEIAEDTCNVELGDVYNKINVVGNVPEADTSFEVESSDNEQLRAYNDNKYTIRLVKQEGTDKVSELDLSKSTLEAHMINYWSRYDSSLSLPRTINSATTIPWRFDPTDASGDTIPTSAPYYLLQTGTILPVGNSIMSRYAKAEIETLPNSSVKTNSITFTNCITFPIGNCTHLTLSNYGKYSAKTSLSAITGNCIFSKTIEGQRYESEDYLIISFDLKYSSQLAPNLELNKSEFPLYSSGGSETGFSTSSYTMMYQDAKVKTYSSIRKKISFVLKTVIKLGDWYYVDQGSGGWSKTFGYCNIVGEPLDNKSSWNTTLNPLNNNEFTNLANSTTKGLAIKVPEGLYGDLTIQIYDVMAKPFCKTEINEYVNAGLLGSGYKDYSEIGNEDGDALDYKVRYCHISNLQIEHATQDKNDVFDLSYDSNNYDTTYTQVIDDNNVSELGDITCDICTYNPDMAKTVSYAYIMDANNEYVQNVYKNGYIARPEEHIAMAYYNQYAKPKLNYENTFVEPVKNSATDTYELIYIPRFKAYFAPLTKEFTPTLNKVSIKGIQLYDISE